VPIYKSPEDLAKISEKVNPIFEELKAKGISVKYDDDDKQRSGWKFAEYELRGVPIRLGLGLRDLENNQIEVARRDTLTKESHPIDGIAGYVADLLNEIQTSIYQKAFDFREQNTFLVDNWEDFKSQIEKGGFISAHWDGTKETEEAIKNETKATIRCIPLNAPPEEGKCVYSGKQSNKRVIYARSY
jgi:prolyl-tRNA synthetase